MGNGLLAFAAGMGTGYMGAKQRERDQQRQDKQDAWQTEQQDWQREERQQKMSLQRGLKDATRSASVNENGATLSMADGTTTAYDDGDVAGSDFRQLRRADEATGRQTLASAPYKGLTPTTSPSADTSQAPADTQPAMGLADLRTPMAPQRTATMNGKAFGSLAEAKAAGASYDAPGALNARQAAVYRANGQPDKAMQLESGATSQELSTLQLGEAKQSVADKAVVRKIGSLQTPEDIARFLTEYPNDGHGGGLKADVARSADGKTWSMVATKPDGTIVPIPGDFTNDENGMTEAHITLLSKLNPEKRIEMYKWDREFGQKQRVAANTERHQGVLEDIARVTAEAAKTRAGAAVTASGNKQQLKPLTDSQGKALLFGSRMRESDKILDGLAVDGTTLSVPGSRGIFGGVINAASPENIQKLDQAKRDFLNAVLRRESGAVIADSEFESGNKQYFPQIGEGPKVREQKSNARKLALDGILLEVPEGHRNSLQPRSGGEVRPNGLPGSENTAKSKSFSVGGTAMDARQAPDGKYYVKQANGKYAEVRN